MGATANMTEVSEFPAPETYPALASLQGLVHGFLLRHPAIDVKTDRETALERLAGYHAEAARHHLGIPPERTWFGDQVHGHHLETCEADSSARVWPETDGLVTGEPGIFLGIYVADCGAVYLADPVRRCAALVHSGRKGTEEKIAPLAIERLRAEFGSDPSDLVVQLGPCIRPPAYEVDFAATIREDCLAAGVPASQFHDPGTCTTHDPDRYYSYRVEKGRTGRHLALIGWLDEE